MTKIDCVLDDGNPWFSRDHSHFRTVFTPLIGENEFLLETILQVQILIASSIDS